jgi:ketosteroid isomerase-like protein
MGGRVRSIHIFILILFLAGLTTAQTSRRTTPRRTSDASAAQKQQLQDDMEAIQSLHNKDIEASLALDEPALESLWTDDIVTMNPGAPPVVGKAANVARLKAQVEQMKNQEIMAYNEQFQEVRIENDWAYEWGAITGRTRPFSGGNETSYQFNVVRILQRQPDGSWKIARTIYNDAQPSGPPKPAEEKPKPDDRNKLKD